MASARPYHDFQHPKKAAFLAAYREGNSIKAATAIAGVDRTAVYKWLEADAHFAVAFGLAKQDAVEAFEQEARRRAIDGVKKVRGVYHEGVIVGYQEETEYSDTLLIFMLKGMAPEKYRERQDISLAGAKGLKIVIEDTASADVAG